MNLVLDIIKTILVLSIYDHETKSERICACSDTALHRHKNIYFIFSSIGHRCLKYMKLGD